MTRRSFGKMLLALGIWLLLSGLCFVLGTRNATGAGGGPPACMQCSCKMMYAWWSPAVNPPNGMCQLQGFFNPTWVNIQTSYSANMYAAACPDPPNRTQTSWDQAAYFSWPNNQAGFTCTLTPAGPLQEVSVNGTGTQLTQPQYYWYCTN